MDQRSNIIRDRTFSFAIEIIKLSRILRKHQEDVISMQLLKSGTSIGANVEESIGAASRRDFISKLTIVYKEARETLYWLRLIKATYSFVDVDDLNDQNSQILRILTSILKTSKQKSA